MRDFRLTDDIVTGPVTDDLFDEYDDEFDGVRDEPDAIDRFIERLHRVERAEPADGGASGSTTHKFTHVGSAVLEVQHSDTMNVKPNVTQNRSIFIAAKSGTVAVQMVFEQAKG